MVAAEVTLLITILFCVIAADQIQGLLWLFIPFMGYGLYFIFAINRLENKKECGENCHFHNINE